ncbi:MAG: ABC transporter permease subunit [Planctomycetes bacterium]|nr:ABC transporter permease subunit [Planctomycetota bacterium]MCP4772436.1 ABC transporter permease subunit [Planctomycetota bacterium]MCP4860171.1 ABC transporter permease subunit [Planctomycetota bacterium]
MRAFVALWKREVFSMLVSPFAFVLLGVWFLLNGMLFVVALSTQQVMADLRLLPPFLFGSGMLVWLLLPAFPPLLCIRLFAEEHRVGTLEPLLTAPIRDFAVVLAKYLAACVFFLLFWGGVLLLFLLLHWHGGNLDWARVLGGMLGAILVSFLFLATGLWASSWSSNLVLGAGGGAALNYLLLFVPALFELNEGPLGSVARSMHLPNFLDRGFSAGLLDSYALVYLLGLSALFLFLTWMRLVSRRWVP